MADALDVLTLSEAKEAVNIPSTSTAHDVRLARWVTGVSRSLDRVVGNVVIRTVTGTFPAATYRKSLLTAPVVSITSDTTVDGERVIVYESGRYPTTTTVDASYKLAAEMALQRLWSQYAGAWARGGDQFAVEGEGFVYFKAISPVVNELGLPRVLPGFA
jgi:hypothetical protein